jgi:hypothetical protein
MHVINVILAMGLILLASCGKDLRNKRTSGLDAVKDKTIDVGLSVSSGSLNLLSTFTYEAQITACDSGFPAADPTTVTYTEADTSITMVDGDTNCQFKMTEIIIDGETYDSTHLAAFPTSPSAPQVFNNGNKDLVIEVVATLSATIGAGEAIQVKLSAVQKGTDGGISPISVATGVDVSAADKINLEIFSINFVSSASAWKGSFEFDLECGQAISGNDCSDGTDTVDMTTLKTNFVDDQSTVTDLTSCKTALDFATTAVAGTVDGGIGGNGGFRTATHIGGSKWFFSRDKTLVIGDGSDSCKYYYVTINF